jgi:hypothetical protein
MITKPCMGCGRLSEWEILCQGCQNIVRNLRVTYGTKIAKVVDSDLAKRYNDYNLSDKSEPELYGLV